MLMHFEFRINIFMTKKCLFIALAFCFILQNVIAQTFTANGKVLSTEDGEPIVGASVKITSGNAGTITDINGMFKIEVQDNATLTISYIGLVTKVVKAEKNMIIRLEQDSQNLEEVMVVAYGTAKKSSFTGSADVVKSDKIESRAVASLSKALEGTVSGIQMTSGGGQPGKDAKIVVRGFGSINASNNPLYVLDGIPFDGDINSINPSDIESMSVLKDAAAAALYGARGANGVVMITTKKGKEGTTKINFKASWGVSSRAFPNYETLNSREYLEAVFDGIKQVTMRSKNSATGENYTESEAAEFALNNYMKELGGEQYNPFNMSSTQLIDPTTGKVNASATELYSDDWIDRKSVV